MRVRRQSTVNYNMLGAILGGRNSPWLNGTARVFVTVFGFNTDVSPNDRLPITADTHERSCPMGCVNSTSIAKVACKAQRSQTLTTAPCPPGRWVSPPAQRHTSQLQGVFDTFPIRICQEVHILPVDGHIVQKNALNEFEAVLPHITSGRTYYKKR